MHERPTCVSDSVVHHIAASEGSDLAVLHRETGEASGVKEGSR